MKINVLGYVDGDNHWSRMRHAWNACVAAGVPVPEKLITFFGEKGPDPNGVPQFIQYEAYEKTGDVVLVDLAKLPSDVRRLRVSFEP